MNSHKVKLAALTIGCGLALAATKASAAIVCDDVGDCWHSQTEYVYPPTAGIIVHPDTWTWGDRHYRWREHGGRGYWHGDTWTEF